MRLLVEARPIRHGSIRAYVTVIGDSTRTGIGEFNMRLEWWQRIRHVLTAGCQMDALPLDLDDTTETDVPKGPADVPKLHSDVPK